MSGVDEAVLAEDGVRLWATRVGEGRPVVFCHGGPGLWDFLGDLAGLLADRAAVHRWDQRGCGRSQRCGPYSVARSVADLDAVRRHFGLDRINAEVNRVSGTPELRAACEQLDVPVLIVHGAEDIRPDWALDSLEQALPRVSRTLLAGAGHLPWVEQPDGFRSVVGDFLADL